MTDEVSLPAAGGPDAPPASLTLVQVKRRRAAEPSVKKRGDLTEILGTAGPKPRKPGDLTELLSAPLPELAAPEPEPSAATAPEAASPLLIAATPPEPLLLTGPAGAFAATEPEPAAAPDPFAEELTLAELIAAAPPEPASIALDASAPVPPSVPDAAAGEPDPIALDAAHVEPATPARDPPAEPPLAADPPADWQEFPAVPSTAGRFAAEVPRRRDPPSADELVDYWDQKRGQRPLPALEDIDRVMIAERWSNSLILSLEGDPALPRIHRLGTTNAEIEYTPMVIDWIMSRGRHCARRGMAMEEEERFPMSRGRARYRLLLLPLGRDGRKCEHVLCHLSRAQELSATAAFKRWLAS